MTFPYFEFTVGFIVLVYIFETYLDLRQHARYKAKEVPRELDGVVTQETFTKSQVFHHPFLDPRSPPPLLFFTSPCLTLSFVFQ